MARYLFDEGQGTSSVNSIGLFPPAVLGQPGSSAPEWRPEDEDDTGRSPFVAMYYSATRPGSVVGGSPIQPPPGGGTLPIDLIGGRTSGFGDMIYLGLASPKAGISHGPGQTSVWGLGLGQSFPSASEDLLGSGKWSMGPAAIYAYLGQKWKLGGLLQTYFSYAGDGDRNDVTMMNLQLFYYYALTETISIGAGPNIIADFEADSGDKWTVPIGIGIGKTVQMGKVPVRFMVEYYGSVVRPDTVGMTHNLRFVIIPAVPAGLIPFL